jgi:hypothetical protein
MGANRQVEVITYLGETHFKALVFMASERLKVATDVPEIDFLTKQIKCAEHALSVISAVNNQCACGDLVAAENLQPELYARYG